jgi:hypothetical protein
MPARQRFTLRPIDEPPCPKCRSGMLERAALRPGRRALGDQIFPCNKCDHIESVSKAEGKPHGEIYPPGEPGPAQEASRGSAGRGHAQRHPEAARGGGRKGSRTPEAAKMNHRGVDFTVVPAEPNVWRWQFRIDGKVLTGKTKNALRGIARTPGPDQDRPGAPAIQRRPSVSAGVAPPRVRRHGRRYRCA